MSNEDRLYRVLKFHMSLLSPEVAQLLSVRGFDEQARAEGWQLLDQALGRTRSLPVRHNATPLAKQLVADIDLWENTWFDVADAALGRAFPEIHALLFLNLSKSSNLAVVLNVKTFLDRLDELERSSRPGVAEALALLVKRGLTPARRDEARVLLQKIQTEQPEPAILPSEETARAEQLRALDALWSWYKDWAKTARTVVENKRLRVMMGISQASNTRPDEVVDDALDGEEEPTAPPASGPVLVV